MKHKSTKRQVRTVELNDIQKWRIEQLATNGGFSDRYIASQIFGIRLWNLTKDQIRPVTRHRSRLKMRLFDWRNGLTPMAKAYAKQMQKTRKAS